MPKFTPSTDKTPGLRINSLMPVENFFAATPDDAADEEETSTGGIFVGVGGNLQVVRTDDVVVPFLNVPDGAYLPIVAKRINDTDTTATDIVFYVADAGVPE